ncbi:deoxyribodipyrimidine photo-lyase [Colwellia sp. RE-S-Sl-9]
MNVIWFRKDLRIYDNPALTQAITDKRCKAVYISTPLQWQQHDMAPIQADFIERHLNLLAEQLSELGITLDYIESTDYNDQISQLLSYCEQHNIDNIYANSEVEINEQNRDNKLQQAISNTDLSLHLFEADVIVEKGKVLNGDKAMYKVFTPFKNNWADQLAKHSFTMSYPPKVMNTVTKPPIVTLAKITLNTPKVCSKKWPLVSDVLDQIIPSFIEDKHDEYKEYRDFPALKGTSGLSPYLAIGAISAKALLFNVLQKHPHLLENPKADKFCWVNELAWRDFYKHLLFHFPQLCKHKNFQTKYDHLLWRNTPQHFQAWCEGRTGYPLVDAAMKQLVTTGWMHNRLRMVVASFLTKHLLIDWRLGERFFMQNLIDGDFSANNGGWQWAASAGCDTQPYFRIFNPIRQSERFDPDGSFIKKYIPELSDVPAKHIHFPHKYLASIGATQSYPEPIVDHKTARLDALDFYKV